MKTKLFLVVVLCQLVISTVTATDYQFDAGSYTVKFNCSQELVILPPLPHEESGSHATGWDITIQDNMSHSLGVIAIVEEDQIVPLSNEVMATLLDNNMEELSGLKDKKPIKLNGAEGLMSEGYIPQLGMSSKLAIAPFNPFYDSFYSQMATKSFIIFNGLDLPIFDEILNSLNITVQMT